MNTYLTKQKQTFLFNAPTAESVLLVGDFTQWQHHPIALQMQPNGTWKTTTFLNPGTYHYRFLVDGHWRDDPNCRVRVYNVFGTQDDVLQVPGLEHRKCQDHPARSLRHSL